MARPNKAILYIVPAVAAVLHVVSANAQTATPSTNVSCETARKILKQADMLKERQSCATMQQLVSLAISKLDAEKAEIEIKQNNIAQEMLAELWKDEPKARD